MTAKTKALCSGCRDDFYNHTPMGLNVKDGKPQCWSFDTAEVVKMRFVHVDQVPPWTNKPETTLSCHKRPRFVKVRPEVTR